MTIDPCRTVETFDLDSVDSNNVIQRFLAFRCPVAGFMLERVIRFHYITQQALICRAPLCRTSHFVAARAPQLHYLGFEGNASTQFNNMLTELVSSNEDPEFFSWSRLLAKVLT